jgi:hypothetical protein
MMYLLVYIEDKTQNIFTNETNIYINSSTQSKSWCFFFFSNMHLAEELIVPNKHTYYFINLFFCYKSNVKLHFFL